VGRALDLAVLTGSGAAGQPLGLAGTGGIATASGTSITWATLAQLRATVEQGAGSDRGLQWLGGYTAHRVLAAREKVATSGNMIWADRRIDGDPAAVTKGSPADSLFMGDWTQLAVVLFGAAIRVEVDPFSQFRTGVVGMRCVLACDTAVMMPSAFGAVSSIT
jgi:hypothetical protein